MRYNKEIGFSPPKGFVNSLPPPSHPHTPTHTHYLKAQDFPWWNWLGGQRFCICIFQYVLFPEDHGLYQWREFKTRQDVFCFFFLRVRHSPALALFCRIWERVSSTCCLRLWRRALLLREWEVCFSHYTGREETFRSSLRSATCKSSRDKRLLLSAFYCLQNKPGHNGGWTFWHIETKLTGSQKVRKMKSGCVIGGPSLHYLTVTFNKGEKVL